MIGNVENDEPMPMVTMRPTTNMASAAIALLSPKKSWTAATSGSTCPDSLMTAANPWAEIMTNPISAIIRIPEVKTTTALFHSTTAETRKMPSPTGEPNDKPIDSEHENSTMSWEKNAATSA